ncbi:MAG: hypothetical protein EOP11_12545 [Proteobacteria bacterium]|nr:MAG: hypothetical protein EOP11_12545 [Pseudomonadota bacterium]
MKAVIKCLFFLLATAACAPMGTVPMPSKELMAAAKKDIRENSCNYDGAYEWGANDARKDAPMDGKGLASYCAASDRAAVMKGYREGYSSVAGARRGARDRVVVVQKDYPQRDCITAYGEKACGFDCKSAHGNVKCAQNPAHRCLVDFGDIYCGLNCRSEYGRVECDKRE